MCGGVRVGIGDHHEKDPLRNDVPCMLALQIRQPAHRVRRARAGRGTIAYRRGRWTRREPARGRGGAADSMDALRHVAEGHQGSSAVISGHQGQSVAISGNQRQSAHLHHVAESVVTVDGAAREFEPVPDEEGHQRGHQRPSERLSGNSSTYTASSGNQWQSVAISGNQWQSVAISGNQWQSENSSTYTASWLAADS